jgi:hypothetical protein
VTTQSDSVVSERKQPNGAGIARRGDMKKTRSVRVLLGVLALGVLVAVYLIHSTAGWMMLVALAVHIVVESGARPQRRR